MMRDLAISPNGADGATPSDIGSVTAKYIAPDLRALAVPIDSLRPMPGNARAHGERDLSALTESLRRHGQRKPGVAKRTYRGLSNVLLAGHGTLQAARRLGWKHIAVSWFDGTDDEAREYAIRDNRTSDLSQFDSNQLAALQADGVDLLTLGWTGAELGDLLALADAETVPHFAPDSPVSRLDVLEPHCPTCRCREVK
jgi:hypothetical protein